MAAHNLPNEDETKLFEGYVLHWQNILNLRDWRIERENKPASKDAMAEVGFDDCQRLAVYRLGDFGETAITPQSLNKTALHEILHVFLRDLLVVVADPRSTDEQLDAAQHRVVNVLERVLTED